MPQETCPNIFTLKKFLDENGAYAIAGFNFVLLPISLIGNILIMVTLYRTKQLALQINKLYFYLALLYSLHALLAQPFVLMTLIGIRGGTSCIPEMLGHFTYFFFSNASSSIVIAIGIDQLVQLTNIVWYKYAMTWIKTMGLLIAKSAALVAFFFGYTVATHYRKHSIVTTILSLLILFSAIVLILAIVRRYRINTAVRRRETFSEGTEQSQCPSSYQDIRMVIVMLSATAMGSILLAVVEVYNVTNGMPGVNNQAGVSDTPSHLQGNYSWLSYFLYLAMTFQPLNGALYAVIYFYGQKGSFQVLR